MGFNKGSDWKKGFRGKNQDGVEKKGQGKEKAGHDKSSGGEIAFWLSCGKGRTYKKTGGE